MTENSEKGIVTWLSRQVLESQDSPEALLKVLMRVFSMAASASVRAHAQGCCGRWELVNVEPRVDFYPEGSMYGDDLVESDAFLVTLWFRFGSVPEEVREHVLAEEAKDA